MPRDNITIYDAVEEVRAYLRGPEDKRPDHWTLEQWVVALNIHVGRAAEAAHAGSVEGTDLSNSTLVAEHLLVVAALCVDAVESITLEKE